jgi:thiamine pyrophosphokinase
MPRAVIFANGILPNPAAAGRLLLKDDFIIAADGGLRNALSLGAVPRLLIGDLDSISSGELEEAQKAGVEILRFPPEKDETDLELAVRYAVENRYQAVRILGALGGRLDQTLGNIALLADTPPEVDIRLDDGLEEVLLINSRAEIEGGPGDLISLIPWGMPAEGVATKGLRYPLRGETLRPHKTRGISNELLGWRATVILSKGTLIAVHSRKRASAVEI